MTTQSINIATQQEERKNRSLIFAGLGLLIFLVLGIWGGLPPEGERAAFIGGIVFLVLMVFVSGIATWHLMIRPLPVGHKTISRPLVNPVYRQVMAILLAISTLSLTVGGVWDEIWHRDFGLPFGEDLFWRPHLLMYGAFLIVIGLGLFGWYTIMTKGRGTLQQRFRSDPILAYLTLLGTFLIYSLPFDPLWHMIYGEDISAWSVPHIILGTTFLLVTILFLASQLSIMPKRQWSGVQNMNLMTIGLITVLSFLTPPLLQLLVLEWSMTEGTVSATSVVAQRPEWMLPALLTFATIFIANLVTHALKRVGVATLVLVVGYLFRLLLISMASNPNINAVMWLLAIPPAIGVDIVNVIGYWRTGRVPSWFISSLGGVVTSLLIGVPAINALLIIPEIGWVDLLTVIPAMLIAGAVAGWMGYMLGNFATEVDNQSEGYEVQLLQVRRALPVALILYVVFIAWFIITAVPPVDVA
ncbi:MAG: hypothetical protein AAF846_08815 [Chloroflexota bacterium]